MTTTTLIVGIVLLLSAVIAIGLPFISQRRQTRADSNTQLKRDELLTSYERILTTIRDLDEDHQTGKLAETTYQHERQYWTEQGIHLLQQLEDTIDEAIPTQATSIINDTDDDAIERAIAEYREVHA